MGVSGPGTSQLRALAAKCRKLGDALPKIAKEMGAESLRLNKRSFASQQSPDGDGWEKGPHTSSPMLRKSGKLVGSIKQTGSDLTFGIRAGARYAFYHQHGAILRDAAPKSRFRRTKLIGFGRGRSGPKRLGVFSGPVRKGRERGFLPARPIVPSGDVPRAWQPALERIADRRIRSALGF